MSGRVAVATWPAGGLGSAVGPSAPTVGGSLVDHDAATGTWTLEVDVTERGWATVDVRA
jgi:hypothetical protein